MTVLATVPAKPQLHLRRLLTLGCRELVVHLLPVRLIVGVLGRLLVPIVGARLILGDMVGPKVEEIGVYAKLVACPITAVRA